MITFHPDGVVLSYHCHIHAMGWLTFFQLFFVPLHFSRVFNQSERMIAIWLQSLAIGICSWFVENLQPTTSEREVVYN
jgi:hypothetical protein